MEIVIKYLEEKGQNISNYLKLYGLTLSDEKREKEINRHMQFITAIEMLKGCEWQDADTGGNNALLPDVSNNEVAVCPKCGAEETTFDDIYDKSRCCICDYKW